MNESQRVYSRPLIAIPARFSQTTSATRFSAIVTARKIAEMLWDAGAEPATLLPVNGVPWQDRLANFDGVLMPGGADIDPSNYGQLHNSSELYGIDPLQDETDLALVRFALKKGLPLLTICRGTQVANVALGGTLVQHMSNPHLNQISTIEFQNLDSDIGVTGPLQVSCFHHQAIDKLGEGISILATSSEGLCEAVRYPSTSWAYGLQWHPEDNYLTEPSQLHIIAAFVEAARNYSRRV